ncbi:MAG: DUF393 domain-containing protein [Gemmataceae bacterium]|nr:DUF393 domain-containing protein [Gemmata sp.]MDW8198520.1 DUF393 domain-containing protein [Gemmataceae bacterium]
MNGAPQGHRADGKAIVLYDGDCPLCQRSIWLLQKLDWRKCFAYQNCRDSAPLPACDEPLLPDKLLEQMHVVTPNRRWVLSGYRAIRWIAWRLPLTSPLAPLLYIPGMLWLGQRAYLWLARKRFQLIPCPANGVCQRPSLPRPDRK